MNQAKAVLFVVCSALAASSVGCGYSEEEMQVKRDRIDQLTRALDKLEQDQRELQDRFKGVAAENAELNERLRQMGMLRREHKKALDEASNRFTRQILVKPHREYHLEQFDLKGA